LLKIEIPLLREECCQIQKIGTSASSVLAIFLKIEVIVTFFTSPHTSLVNTVARGSNE
jgi:hypothetical protein